MDERGDLEARYLELTRVELPSRAARNQWPIREDHCFMRILLDRLFEDCWYNHLSRRRGPAYRQLSDKQLRTLIGWAETLIQDDGELLAAWNRDSLWWRGKL